MSSITSPTLPSMRESRLQKEPSIKVRVVTLTLSKYGGIVVDESKLIGMKLVWNSRYKRI